MAEIFNTLDSIINNAGVTDMKTLINNYWGSETREKSFPISLWRLNQLFSLANSEKITLRIKDIDDPLLVDADWMTFEDELEDLLEASSVESNNSYFVLDESDFEEIKESIDAKPSHKIIMLGRIGQKEIQTVDEEGDPVTTIKYFVFFYPAEYEIILPGTGGGGASGGAKVPAN